MIPFTSLCPGAQIALLAGILGLLTAAAAYRVTPRRWFMWGWRLFERPAYFVALWLWASIGWALLFAWPFFEKGLAL